MKTQRLFGLILLLMIGFSSVLQAQQAEKPAPVQVKIEGAAIYFNGLHVLNYEKISLVEWAVNDLSNNEIFSYRFLNNETPDYRDDDYFIVYFINERMKVESTNYSLVLQGVGLNFRKNTEKLINNLLKFSVLDEDGQINYDQLEKFVIKYDERITVRTQRF